MKKPKHPRDMNNTELMRHLFHPKVVKHIKEAARVPKEKRIDRA
jgi:hypothetical protein